MAIDKSTIKPIQEGQTGRVVADNMKANFDYLADNVPTKLSEMSEDTSHRVVTDAEKKSWNAKYDSNNSNNATTDWNCNNLIAKSYVRVGHPAGDGVSNTGLLSHNKSAFEITSGTKSDGSRIPIILGWRDLTAAKFDSSGNLGIGTTTPFSSLTLKQGTGLGLEHAITTNADVRRWWIQNDQVVYGDFLIRTASKKDATSPDLTRIYINPHGNVGVGTTTPSSKVEVKSTTASTFKLDTTDANIYQTFLINGERKGEIGWHPLLGMYMQGHYTGGDRTIGINPQNGYIGINQFPATAMLDVNGNSKASAFVLANGGGKGLFPQRQVSGGGDENDIWLYNPAQVSIQGSNILLYPQTTGVGIGVDKPSAKLDVNGDIRTRGQYLSGSADYAEMFEWVDGNPNNEERVGYLVEINGEKVQKANGGTIIGVVSSDPAFIGDNQAEWKHKYLTDEWGRKIPCKVTKTRTKTVKKTRDKVEMQKVQKERDVIVTKEVQKYEEKEVERMITIYVLEMDENGNEVEVPKQVKEKSIEKVPMYEEKVEKVEKKVWVTKEDEFGNPIDVEETVTTIEHKQVPIMETIETTEKETYEVEEEVTVPEEYEEEVEETYEEDGFELNPDYDETLEYKERKDRPEWAIVGLLGKLIVRQDGTLKVGGRASAKDGIATNNPKGNVYVMKVIDSTHALVLVK